MRPTGVTGLPLLPIALIAATLAASCGGGKLQPLAQLRQRQLAVGYGTSAQGVTSIAVTLSFAEVGQPLADDCPTVDVTARVNGRPVRVSQDGGPSYGWVDTLVPADGMSSGKKATCLPLLIEDQIPAPADGSLSVEIADPSLTVSAVSHDIVPTAALQAGTASLTQDDGDPHGYEWALPFESSQPVVITTDLYSTPPAAALVAGAQLVTLTVNSPEWPDGFFTQIRQPDESQFDLVLSMGDGGLVDPFTLVIQPTVYVETASFDACVGADTCKGLGSTVLPPLTEPVPGDETLVCRRGCHAFCGPCTTFNGGR